MAKFMQSIVARNCGGARWVWEMVWWSRLFFFSSRRRHTRLQGDWSSDVCSSDLRDGTTFALARRLDQRGVPVMFVSAARKIDIPTELSAAPLLPKPYRAAEVKAAKIGRASCRERV